MSAQSAVGGDARERKNSVRVREAAAAAVAERGESIGSGSSSGERREGERASDRVQPCKRSG